VEPSQHMANRYAEYRRTIGATLQHAFQQNFASVEVCGQGIGFGTRTGGYASRNAGEHDHQVRSRADLGWPELLDEVGESDGKTIAMKGKPDTLRAKYDGVIEELTDFTLASSRRRHTTPSCVPRSWS